MTAQTSIEAVARRLCLAADQDPDMTVSVEPWRISTPSGTRYAMPGMIAPLWYAYLEQAEAVIADLAAGRIG